MCVQRFDDSLNSAIHTTYRISLRSSSMPEPRDPLLKVVIITLFTDADCNYKKVYGLVLVAGEPAQETRSAQKTWVNNSDKLEPSPRYSSLKSNNCNALSPARLSFTRLPRPLGQGENSLAQSV
ncbi:hypothetical protein Tco_1579320 [Tanacetum coccineum]